ncbi:MAG: hypothetical protein HY900_28770 [Deltaproteobacteria bacterium]|nr:hypothetical protein [Deltaproteobacteria bacterium]
MGYEDVDHVDLHRERGIHHLGVPKPTVRKFPDFSKMKSEGSIYSATWDVPLRNSTAGFPGATDRFAWFAIDYRGTIYVPKEGTYAFRMFSDDGSKLYLDDKAIIDLDGLHAWAGKKGRAGLIVGEHEFHLSYMQGPPTQLGLQLWVTPPGEKEKIFRLQDFSKALADGRRQLQVTEDAKEIRVKSCTRGTKGRAPTARVFAWA